MEGDRRSPMGQSEPRGRDKKGVGELVTSSPSSSFFLFPPLHTQVSPRSLAPSPSHSPGRSLANKDPRSSVCFDFDTRRKVLENQRSSPCLSSGGTPPWLRPPRPPRPPPPRPRRPPRGPPPSPPRDPPRPPRPPPRRTSCTIRCSNSTATRRRRTRPPPPPSPGPSRSTTRRSTAARSQPEEEEERVEGPC